MTQVNTERRRAPRATVDIPLHLSPRENAEPAKLINISASGICCQFSEAISEMTLVGIGLELPGIDGIAEVQGAVVRCDKVRGINPPTYELGIFFTAMSNETRAAIQDFVDAQLKMEV